MAYVDWMIKGKKLGGCNCDFGCPCEFNGRPSRGSCEGWEAMEIDQGWFGDVRLDGLRIASRYRWPGAVHEGGGHAQSFIDERASARQREALGQILGGKEQEPTTVFNIYGSTIVKEHDTIYAPIEFEWDLGARTGRLRIPNAIEASLQPIRNPVTGKPHRALIKLPEGFEYREAEMASGQAKSSGDIALELDGTYGALWYAAYGPFGIIDLK